jgi:hypothetical protein
MRCNMPMVLSPLTGLRICFSALRPGAFAPGYPLSPLRGSPITTELPEFLGSSQPPTPAARPLDGE